MTLEELLESEAIKRVYTAYCDAIDEKDFNALRAVFAPDCQLDFSEVVAGSVVTVTGVEALISSAQAQMGEGSLCGRTHHNVTNFRIDVTENLARARVHFYAVHGGLGEFSGQLFSCWGEYDDRLVKTPQGWRVSKRDYRSFLTEGPGHIVGYQS